MAASRKQIAFDLDTKALKIYYPSESWNNAYDVIKRHMENSGFKWLQGSVYVSEKPMSPVKVTDTLCELVEKNPWLNLCMRDCRETNIGREHNQNHIFDKNADIPTREELKANKEKKASSMEDWKKQIKEMKEKGGGTPKKAEKTRDDKER